MGSVSLSLHFGVSLQYSIFHSSSFWQLSSCVTDFPPDSPSHIGPVDLVAAPRVPRSCLSPAGLNSNVVKCLSAFRMSLGAGCLYFASIWRSLVRKGHRERGTTLARERDRPPELLSQHRDDLQPKGLCVAEVEVRGEANPSITHTQGDVPVFGPQRDVDISGLTVGKGIFQGVGEELIQDEAAGDGGIDVEGQLGEVGV